LGANCRAEEGKRANTEGSSLGLAGGAAAKFTARLVKPGANAALPILAEMVCGEDVVVPETHGLVCQSQV
jgi:hypothetical protein